MNEKKVFFGRRYLALTKGGIMEALTFRTSMLTAIIGNLVYLVVIYYLWKAIFKAVPSGVVNGMTFYDTMVYLVLASAMFSIMNCFVVWGIGRSFQNGDIVLEMLRPMDYQLYQFFLTSGEYVIQFFTTFLPTIVIVWFVTGGCFELGFNLLFFAISIVFSILLNFAIEFIVGIVCFYTQSIWGINQMKEVVISLLSGASIPLAFFPETLRKVVSFLPFQAIYNTPLQILTDKSLAVTDYLVMLLQQGLWMVGMLLIGRWFWKASAKVLTVNGG